MPEAAAAVVVDMAAVVVDLEILSSYRYPVNMLWMWCLLLFVVLFRTGRLGDGWQGLSIARQGREPASGFVCLSGLVAC